MKAVVEGLALGTLAIGVQAVTSSKLSLELAIARALREWSFAGQFPSLAGRGGASSIWIGIQKSERRRAVLAAWTGSGWLTPYIVMDDWSVEECTEVLAEDGPVPTTGGRSSHNCLSNDSETRVLNREDASLALVSGTLRIGTTYRVSAIRAQRSRNLAGPGISSTLDRSGPSTAACFSVSYYPDSRCGSQCP